jgi:hypothetical protein
MGSSRKRKQQSKIANEAWKKRCTNNRGKQTLYKCNAQNIDIGIECVTVAAAAAARNMILHHHHNINMGTITQSIITIVYLLLTLYLTTCVSVLT